MINHSSTLKATLFAPPNQGVRDLCRSLATHIRRRYKLDRVLLFEHGFTSGSCPVLRRASWARSLRIPTASAVEKDKRSPFTTTKSTLSSHPLLTQSHSCFSTPHNRRFRAMLTISVSFALPHRDPTCVDFVCVLFRFRLHLRASLRRPHGANPIRLRREFCRSCACN